MERTNVRAEPLPSSAVGETFMRRIQGWFEEDLSPVKLFAFSRPDSLEPFETPFAFAQPESIFVSDFVATGDRHRLEFVLTHEFAHIIQKRHGQRLTQCGDVRATPAAVLEHEAETAALAFQNGAGCPRLSADAAATPRAWGPAGHFYTVYWVSRMAGVEDSVAERLAFYAQMPDQVSDFDAKLAGIKWAKSALWRGGRERDQKVGGEDRFDSSIYRIQAGLHCLNHREYKAESDRREAILRKLPDDMFLHLSFGLGLHALGDSFAHRNGDGNTFMAPFGHAGAGETFDEKIIKAGTEIDNLSKHSDRYNEYCGRMFRAVGDRFSNWSAEDRRSVMPELGLKITKVVEKTDEAQQIEVLKRFTPDRRGYYQPENLEPIPWADFRLRYPSFTADWMLEKAQGLAEAWTLGPS